MLQGKYGWHSYTRYIFYLQFYHYAYSKHSLSINWFLGLDIDNIEIFLTTAFSQVALPTPHQLGFLTFVVHNLTVQSNDDVTKRWEKSIGPTAMWQLIPVTGPWWPSKISPMPALLQEEETFAFREWFNIWWFNIWWFNIIFLYS